MTERSRLLLDQMDPVGLSATIAQARLLGTLEDLALGPLSSPQDEAILEVDMEGIILQCNPATERLLGFPTRGALGSPLQSLVTPAAPWSWADVLLPARAGALLRDVPVHLWGPGKSRVPARATVSPALAEDGRALGLVVDLRLGDHHETPAPPVHAHADRAPLMA
jgi:PAS domain-containing protein